MIYSYINTLLDKWIEWSEGFLSETLTSQTNDLNTILGTIGADSPTRSNEFFNIGFLNLKLTGSPIAYDNLRDSKPVQSSLGYIAYLIAKAKQLRPDNTIVNNGFNAVATLCLIQQFEQTDNKQISLLSILISLIKKFPIPPNCDERIFLRFLASAMFCELNIRKDSFLNEIIGGETPSLRIVDRETQKIKATFTSSADIKNAIENRLSLTGIVYEKGSVFFIGNPKDNNPRGLFSLAYKKFKDFLFDFHEIEYKNIENNPFKKIYNTAENQNKISDLKSIFSLNNNTQNLLNLMKTLEEGCLEAIKVLGWKTVAPIQSNPQNIGNTPHQIIFYGSPGTGKSREIEMRTNGHARTRTTFHPETDYHSFVGSYKPVMEGINIKYDFVPQAFTNAYCKAWLNPEQPYFLIIEEINRGNCAQIFGDLFQCLDRDDNGFSKYEINCDKDLANYIKSVFESDDNLEAVENYKEKIQTEDFDKIILPNNLYVLATMNTSDQSLFPMDSAFKRRWDWEFVPINYEDASSLNIVVGDITYNWGKFIENINPKIKELTGSEDKQLGNRFVNPKGGNITFDQFRSKVLFYLWSEVYKDEFGTQNSIFKYELEENNPIDFQFGELYNNSATEIVKAFLKFNGIEPEQ